MRYKSEFCPETNLLKNSEGWVASNACVDTFGNFYKNSTEFSFENN